jgi:hypothetical protein
MAGFSALAAAVVTTTLVGTLASKMAGLSTLAAAIVACACDYNYVGIEVRLKVHPDKTITTVETQSRGRMLRKHFQSQHVGSNFHL